MAVSEPYMGALNGNIRGVNSDHYSTPTGSENYYQIAETEKNSAASLLAI